MTECNQLLCTQLLLSQHVFTEQERSSESFIHPMSRVSQRVERSPPLCRFRFPSVGGLIRDPVSVDPTPSVCFRSPHYNRSEPVCQPLGPSKVLMGWVSCSAPVLWMPVYWGLVRLYWSGGQRPSPSTTLILWHTLPHLSRGFRWVVLMSGIRLSDGMRVPCYVMLWCCRNVSLTVHTLSVYNRL